MPWLRENLQDGQRPSSRWVPEGTPQKAGQLVQEEDDYYASYDWVWDSSSGELRAPTTEEQLQPERASRNREIDAEMVEEFEAVMPIYKAVAILIDKSNAPELASLKGLAARHDAARNAVNNAKNQNDLDNARVRNN